ncbi:hypothetical protein HPP92_002465 [Vanilla planifolia]|uniref:Uncharacterized protein n=1 Tax=Vanilla planifolia TaxID=51239 RepID=A0A835RY88_VANPL|nr:hypothetical protein HPP92_002465 [Vanilla planifolia]
MGIGTGKVTETLGSAVRGIDGCEASARSCGSEVQEAACITPREDVLGDRQFGWEFRSPSPFAWKMPMVQSWRFWAELSHSFAAEGENIARFRGCSGRQVNQALHSPRRALNVSLFLSMW